MNSTTNWGEIPWNVIEYEIHDLQNKIYNYSLNKNQVIDKRVHFLQKELVNSWSAKLLAVRKVTQDNRGKSTPGVDGITITSGPERIKLAKKLILDGKTNKIRRVYIPKTNGEFRPLGIPTMLDRCKQMLVKMALEPEWEALFEPNSLGSRPGYSVADAKFVVTRQIQGGSKYFLDADIEGCFDNIDHNYLLRKLNTFPMFEYQIKSWLEARIVDTKSTDIYKPQLDNIEEQFNDKGTPQGGVISPLLSNIALNGLEMQLLNRFKRKVKFVRYVDDLLVFSKDLSIIHESKIMVEKFLDPIGLKLSESKTRVGHTLHSHENGMIGVEYLGFYFRNFEVSKHRGVKSTRGVKQQFIQKSSPSRKSVKKQKEKIRKILGVLKNAALPLVISKLSLVIKGWTEFFSVSSCTEVFTYLDGWLWNTLWRWAVKRYKSANRAKKQCFNVKGWAFGCKANGKTYILKRHDQTNIKKYVKIKSGASVYGDDVLYFAKRMSNHNSKIRRMQQLLKKQSYRCSTCNGLFYPNDIIELHHLIDDDKQRIGGYAFVHGHCHDNLHKSKV